MWCLCWGQPSASSVRPRLNPVGVLTLDNQMQGEHPMKHSESRILTTHTGSLPRPERLVEMLGAVSRGVRVDEAALESMAAEATAGVVSAQLAAGVDVINNGEQSRVSFSTYVTQRMSGFGGCVEPARPPRPERVPVRSASPRRPADARRANLRRTVGV